MLNRNTMRSLLEQPAMHNYMPDIFGKKVLEIGCGCGKNCRYFAENGAVKVLGTHMSGRMLKIAKRKSVGLPIEYRLLAPEKAAGVDEKFDVIYSSLVFHYVEHFDKFIAGLNSLLHKDGILLFSQKHPITTASLDRQPGWNYDERGKEISYTFSNYHQSGRRGSNWFIDDEVIYHRTVGEIVTALGQHGFYVEAADETRPSSAIIKQYPQLEKEMLKPAFLVIRARKI